MLRSDRDFKCRSAAARNSPHLEGCEFPRRSGAGEQQPLGFDAFRLMHQRHLEDLAGDFSRTINIAERVFEPVIGLALKSQGDERIALQRFDRLLFQMNLHLVSVFGFTAADGLARLGFRSAGAFGLALVVHLFATRERHLALDAAALQVNLGGNQGQPLLPGLP